MRGGDGTKASAPFCAGKVESVGKRSRRKKLWCVGKGLREARAMAGISVFRVVEGDLDRENETCFFEIAGYRPRSNEMLIGRTLKEI